MKLSIIIWRKEKKVLLEQLRIWLERAILKKSYECPEKGVGDKYFMEGNYNTGEITVKCPNEAKFPDHVLPESLTE